MQLERLVRERMFELEWTSSHLDTAKFREFCAERGARAAEKVPMTAGFDATSVSFREGQQHLVQQLPIGARTLLLRDEKVVLRGLNKFTDLPTEWRRPLAEALEHGFPVVAQRKLAGFVAHVTSLDGATVEIVTKHSTTGPHATWARDMWNELAAKQSMLAAELHEKRLVLCCECVDLEHDRGHPVLEPRDLGDRRLVCFAVQRRDTLQELALPTEEAEQWCRTRGIPFAPSRRLRSLDEMTALVATMCNWHGTVFGEDVCEGVVVIVELPPQLVRLTFSSAAVSEVSDVVNFVAPLRVKLKAEKYKVLRSLRSRALNESTTLSARNAFAIHPFHEVFVAWCVHVTHWSAAELEKQVRERGIADVVSEFERYCQRKRRRDDEPIASQKETGSYSDLLCWAGDIARRKSPAQQNQQQHQHTLVLACGLPGSGKSTAVRGVATRAAAGPFRWIFVVGRDAVTQRLTSDLAAKGDDLSKHALRRLRGAVHAELLTQVARTAAALNWCPGPCLVLLDACHAENRTREFWMSQFPPNVRKIVAFFSCRTAAARAAVRTDHEVLAGDSEAAERATFAVAKRFNSPAGENVITLDTELLDAERTCDTLCRSIGWSDDAGQDHLPQVVDGADLDEKFFGPMLDTFTRRLLGTSPVRNFWSSGREVGRHAASVGITAVAGANWNGLVAAVVAAVSEVLDPPTTGTSFVSRLKQAIFPTRRCSVERGHTRWLEGLVASRRYRSKEQLGLRPLQEVVESELRDRLVLTKELHVTLYYATGHGAENACRDWLAACGLQEGMDATVFASGAVLSLDCAVCRVSAVVLPSSKSSPPTASRNSFDSTEYPLHVTVGCSRGTESIEGAILLESVEELQRENERFREEKARRKAAATAHPAAAPSARDTKMHNFVEVRFAEPIKLVGRIALR